MNLPTENVNLQLIDTKGAVTGSMSPAAADGNTQGVTLTGLSVVVDDHTVVSVSTPTSTDQTGTWTVTPLKVGTANITVTAMNDAGDTLTSVTAVSVLASTTATSLNISYTKQA